MYPIVLENPIQVTSFGVLVALGFLVGGYMAALSYERGGRTADEAWNHLIWVAVGAILCAKLWYAGEQWARTGELGPHLLSRGGLTWYGGLLGGLIASWLYLRRIGLSFVQGGEFCAPSLAVGQALGRVGCFLVGDDWGRPTDLPWGIAFPKGIDPVQEPVHPTQLYEVAWLVPAGIWLWLRRGRSPFLLGEYFFLAGLGRLWIEAFRVNPPLLGPLSNAQVVALACMVFGAGGWLYLRSRERSAPPAASAPRSTRGA